MDAQWSDDFHHALFTLLHRDEEGKGYYVDFGSMHDLAKSLTDVFVYNGIYSAHRCKVHGAPASQLSMHRFVSCIQNHDQVGNRATGDRLEHIIGLERAKAGLGLVLTAPFVPLLFQGEEFAASSPFQYFAHHEDPEMARAVSEGRRREFAAFGWSPDEVPDPESRNTFVRSKLKWEEVLQGAHAEMLRWCRELIAFRRNSRDLSNGEPDSVNVEFSEEGKWLKMDRGQTRIVLNLGESPMEIECGGFALRLASGEGVTMAAKALVVPPSRLAVLTTV